VAGVAAPEAPYQVMPALTAEQYAALKADIKARGVVVPVEVDEAGAILDGHNRAAIATELEQTYPTVVRRGMTEAQKKQYARTINLARRHLTSEQQRQVANDLRAEGLSLRRIASLMGVDHVTILNLLTPVRAPLPAGGEYSPPATVVGADGKTYPARKPSKPHKQAHAERLEAYREAAAVTLERPAAALPFGEVVKADARSFLESLPAGAVHLAVTSPPYWAKREYTGDPRELGRETDPEAYVATLTGIVNEIGRVLAPGGYLFLNLGDTYASQPGVYRGDPDRARGVSALAVQANGSALEGRELDVAEKSLALIPWRVALALTRAHGWRCANVIPWVKRNPLRENVFDRLRQQWEPILVLTRSHHAYLDDTRVRELGATDVWELPVGRRGAGRGHYAPFPDALVERAITLACPPEGVLLDVFAGSGTVRDVAHRMGRRFLGCDLDPGGVPG
jgi:DNA modification methylase